MENLKKINKISDVYTNSKGKAWFIIDTVAGRTKLPDGKKVFEQSKSYFQDEILDFEDGKSLSEVLKEEIAEDGFTWFDVNPKKMLTGSKAQS